MPRKSINPTLLLLLILPLSACSVIRTTGNVLHTTGKVGVVATKVGWKATKIAGKTSWWLSKKTYKGVRTVVYMAKGKQIIPLERRGDSFYVNVWLNKRYKTKMLVDTGASSVQIPRLLAEKMGLKLKKAEQTRVTLAGGFQVPAYRVLLKEVRLGGVRVKNVEAIVLTQDTGNEGLLGISFLEHFHFSFLPGSNELILQQRVPE